MTDHRWIVYTDGACSGNPGPGGWAAIMMGAGRYLELGGGDPATTNNRMELLGAIEALKHLPAGATCVILTDSEYVKKGITQWVASWKRKNWRKSDGAPVLNVEFWRELDGLNGRHVEWRHVRGHQGTWFNERADEIANAFSKGARPELHDRALTAADLERANVV